MGAEYKKLTDISYVTDTDVSYYEIGEVDGEFQRNDLEDYIRRFGTEKILKHLAFLQYQVFKTLIKIKHESASDTKVSIVKPSEINIIDHLPQEE